MPSGHCCNRFSAERANNLDADDTNDREKQVA
jgi:hypothetical protein